MHGEFVHLGATDGEQEGVWVWLSGSPVPQHFPWSTGEPNNHGGNEDCMGIWLSDLDVNDVECSTLRHAVCEV